MTVHHIDTTRPTRKTRSRTRALSRKRAATPVNAPPRLTTVLYHPPRGAKPRKIAVGFRSLELLHLLTYDQASRLEMLDRGRPRVGLNAPSTVSLLIKRGFKFRKHRINGPDHGGNRTWWMSYELLGTFRVMEDE